MLDTEKSTVPALEKPGLWVMVPRRNAKLEGGPRSRRNGILLDWGNGWEGGVAMSHQNFTLEK